MLTVLLQYKRIQWLLKRSILEAIVDDLYKNRNARVYDTVSPTIRADRQGLKVVCVKENTKKGYAEATVGDSVNIGQPNSKTRRGRVGKQVAQTLTTSPQQGVVEAIKEHNKNAIHQQDLVQCANGACRTIPAGTHGSTPHLLKTVVGHSPLRIRKLTPKECFRLMGFDDDDFYKAEVVNSNTQLYKQAGNSIVVDVLEAIFTNLKPYLSEREVKK